MHLHLRLIFVYSDSEILKLAYIDQSVHYRIDDNVCKRTGMKFLHDVLAMSDDGGGADVEAVGNLLVDETFGKLDSHFDFAR